MNHGGGPSRPVLSRVTLLADEEAPRLRVAGAAPLRGATTQTSPRNYPESCSQREPKRPKAATEFSISNVRKTHAALDPSNERAMHEVYRRTIAFGGHPNERGVLSATTRMETDETYTSAVAQLTDRPLLITTALKATIEAAVGALRTEKLLNRDMRHARRRSRPMPVFLTGRNPHNVAFADLLGPTAPLPNPACASRQPS